MAQFVMFILQNGETVAINPDLTEAILRSSSGATIVLVDGLTYETKETFEKTVAILGSSNSLF